MSSNLSNFISNLTKQEGKKSNVKVGDIREILKIANQMLNGTLYKLIDLSYNLPNQVETHCVILKNIGPNKLLVVKTVKEITNLGLKEAKDLVDSYPSVIVNKVSKKTSIQVSQTLIAAGATVEVQ